MTYDTVEKCAVGSYPDWRMQQLQYLDDGTETSNVCAGKGQFGRLKDNGQSKVFEHGSKTKPWHRRRCDVAMHEEGEEEEQLERDPTVPKDESNLTQVVTTFRNELNNCLEREQWNDATVFQSGVMRALNLANQYQPIPAELLSELYNGLAASLQPLVRKHQTTDENIAERYQNYIGQLREMANSPG